MNQAELKKILAEPVTKRDVLQITVKRTFTDVNGTVLDKNDPAIPAALQTSYPLYIFGEYDRQGAYSLGNKNTPPPVGVFYLCTFIYGINNPYIYGFSGISNLQGVLTLGDVVTVYVDDLNAPSIYVWISQQAPTRSMGAILANLVSLPYDPDYGYLQTVGLDYYTNNEEQWKENLKFIKYNMLGLVRSDGISPYAWKPAKTINNQFISIKWKFRLDQYQGINSYMLFDTDNITFTFHIRHRLNELSKIN